MRILAIDTALGLCSAAVVDDGRVLASRSDPMQQGHQERLAPLVSEVMSEAELAFAGLDRIAVTVGPGSFTGLRVGLSFAKGLGVALNVPVVGLDSLLVLAASAPRCGVGLALIDARRGQAYVRRFEGARATGPSAALTVPTLASNPAPDWVAGPGVGLVADIWPAAQVDARLAGDPVALARLAVGVDPAGHLPQPVYLRAPDAKLPGGIDP
ncbi:MAG: tRNA (adenosine(37)-N6)-threonylcarbamoyltransferase complex dimerization subunit type 1 TsaB [Caulobacterales bacterium]|nr:tRNA (adenosine(37)-N6)-threonylcarbamoyltransferase complex dimerization subunit type 1 TsaB [Caulobacterales bacterium]